MNLPRVDESQRVAEACHFVFVNRYFHPDHSATSALLSDLAFALAERGDRVSVITSRQRYDAPAWKLPPRERIRGVDVHRIWTSSFGRYNLIGRSVDYLTFYVFAAGRLWRLAREGGIVVAKTDPPMLSVVAVPVSRLRGAKPVNWLQDLFPEVAEALGISHGRLARAILIALRAPRNWSLRGAAMNVAVGDGMGRKLEAIGVTRDRVRVIPNWADGTVIRPVPHRQNPLRAAWGLEGRFVLAYSGNLGRAHEYTTVLDAIGQLEAERKSAIARTAPVTTPPAPEIVWLFIGGGMLYRAFEAEAKRRGLASVQFRPYQPRERLAESLSAADVHLVSLRPELEGLVVPSKYYGIAAAGRAAIFIGDAEGEIGGLLAEAGIGWTVAPNDGAGLAKLAQDLAADPSAVSAVGDRARLTFAQRFGSAQALARWAALLDEVRRT